VILNRRKQPTTADWIELSCALSCYALVLGYIVAFRWDLPWLYVVSLIPGGLSLIAAHYHDWSTEI
jgi:hydrogenase/urease accessory protein HupE